MAAPSGAPGACSAGARGPARGSQASASTRPSAGSGPSGARPPAPPDLAARPRSGRPPSPATRPPPAGILGRGAASRVLHSGRSVLPDCRPAPLPASTRFVIQILPTPMGHAPGLRVGEAWVPAAPRKLRRASPVDTKVAEDVVAD